MSGILLDRRGVLSSRTSHSAYVSAVQASGPSSYWRLGEGPGSPTVADREGAVVGSVISGTLGVAGLADDTDTAWHSDGTQRIEFGNHFAFAGNAPHAFEFIMDATAVVGVEVFMGKHDGSVTGHALGIETDGSILAYRNGVHIIIAAAGAVRFGTRDHFGIYYDGAAYRVYRNGRLIGGPAPHPTAVTDPGAGVPFFLGRGAPWEALLEPTISGTWDELAIYSVAPPAADWKTHADKLGLVPALTAYDNLVLATAGIQSYWPLDQDVSDLVGAAALDIEAGTSFVFGADGAPDGRNSAAINGGSVGLLADLYAFPNGGFTMELLINPGAYGDPGGIFGRYGPGDNGYSMWASGGTFRPWRYGGTAADAWDSGVPIVGGFQLLHWTNDGANSRLYKNGALVAGPHASGGVTPAAPGNLFRIAGNLTYHNVAGDYGRAAVYAGALDAATILAHAHALGLA